MPSARSTSSVVISEPEPVARPFVPSQYQLDIFHWFATSEVRDEISQHLVVEALAGSGKSESILRGIQYAPETRVLVLAFMRRIMQEMKDKLEAMDSRAEVRTAHSLGYRAIRDVLGHVRMCEGKHRFDREQDIADHVIHGLSYGAKYLVAKLVTKARELQPLGATMASLVELAYDFDLVPPPQDRLTVHEVARATLRGLEYAKNPDGFRKTGIDHADQIYLPLACDLMTPQYDMVIVDEAQDLTVAQLEMARRACIPNGRIVIVGDSHQAIFGFRGADSNSLDRLRKELHAEALPLSRTYRCPQAVVRLAQRYVPQYECDESAPEGTIDTLADLDALIDTAAAGDFILSRKKAPLARVALRLLRAGKPAEIQGRDIGAGLRALTKLLGKGEAEHSIRAFLARVASYEDKQADKLIVSGHADRLDALHDKCETLRYLSQDMSGVPTLLARIETLFTDEPGRAVVCSTVHKAKGLEADRVFILKETFFIPLPCVCGHRHVGRPCKRCACVKHNDDPEARREENNIWYVACTRSKRQLTFCEGSY